MGSKGCVFFLGTQARRQAESLGTIESGAQITVAGFCCMDSAGFFFNSCGYWHIFQGGSQKIWWLSLVLED